MTYSSPVPGKYFDAEAYDRAEKTADRRALNRGFAETITLLVGKEEVKFVVHKDILCAQSGFFKAAFKKEWMRTDDQVLILPADDPDVVNSFLYWIYRTRLYLPDQLFGRGTDPLDGVFGFLAKLWVLSDKYYITSLQNDVIDAIILRHRQYYHVPPEVISFVYENTLQASSPIRRLLVRIADKQYYQHVLDKIDFEFPAKFLSDMWRRCLEVLETYKCPNCGLFDG